MVDTFKMADEVAPSETAAATTGQSTTFSALRRSRTLAKQIEDLTAAVDFDTLSSTDLSAWPKLALHGKEYILEDWLHKKRSRTSWIAEHGWFLLQVNNNKKEGRSWACRICSQLFNGAATSSPALHLNLEHQKYEKGKEPTQPLKKQRSALEMFQSAGKTDVFVTRSVGERFKELLVRWIVNNNLAFVTVEDPDFRALLSLLDTAFVDSLLPKAGNTIRSWLEERYHSHQKLLKRDVLSVPHLKHLSFDLWTSPNSYTLLAIILHYTSTQQKPRSTLLAMIRVRGSHSGENLSSYINTVIQEWGISQQIGYFVTDNADSNDTCIMSLVGSLFPLLSTQERFQLKLEKRLRCIGHIINIVAKAFIEADEKQLLKSLAVEQMQIHCSLEEEAKLLKQWRRRGPIGKLHNIVHHIRRSPQRREAFNRAANYQGSSKADLTAFDALVSNEDPTSLQLKGDNDTRWNSVYEMIVHAIRLKAALEVYCIQAVSDPSHPDSKISSEDILTHQDWLTLVEIQKILANFALATKKFEGNSPTFPEVIATLFRLMEKLKEEESRHHDNLDLTIFDGPDRFSQEVNNIPSDNSESILSSTPVGRPQRQAGIPKKYQDCEIDMPWRQGNLSSLQALPAIAEEADRPVEAEAPEYDVRFIRTSIRFAIKKINEYYNILQHAPVYWYAMILHPGHKKRWIERNLDEERASYIIAGFQQFFQKHYGHLDGPGAVASHIQSPDLTVEDDFLGSSEYHDDVEEGVSWQEELNHYFNGPVKPVPDLYAWWRDNSERLPRLSAMAFDLLSIPAMSSECERVFSRAKLTIGSQRHSLQEDTINMLECLKNWAVV